MTQEPEPALRDQDMISANFKPAQLDSLAPELAGGL